LGIINSHTFRNKLEFIYVYFFISLLIAKKFL
jgi:hypothetical protein